MIEWANKENSDFKYCLSVCYPVCGHISSGSEGSGEILEATRLNRTLQGQTNIQLVTCLPWKMLGLCKMLGMVLRDVSSSPGEVETGRMLGLSVQWLSLVESQRTQWKTV